MYALRTAWREGMNVADPLNTRSVLDDFSSPVSRLARYAFFWRLYDNSIYTALGNDRLRDSLIQIRGLYRYVRSIYNPAARLVDFYASTLMGGGLDPKAGDGEEEQSALPIITDHEAIRPPIARLWADSWWEIHKDTYCRFGACYGDVALMIDDLVDSRKIRLRVLPPGEVIWTQRDPETRKIIGYVIERECDDPREEVYQGRKLNLQLTSTTTTRKRVTYREEAVLDGGKVHYRTLLDGEDYAWDGRSSEWTMDCPFIPMVIVQHENIGLDWGLSCLHAGTHRFTEIDNQVSGLSDQVSKLIRAPKLIAGAAKPKFVAPPESSGPYGDDQSDREELQSIFSPSKDVTVHDLTSTMDIADVTGHIKNIKDALEDMYPELRIGRENQAETSGRAITAHRQVAEARVLARRANYDLGLVTAQKMAIALGGARNYPGYEGFGFDDIDNGKLEHRIGHRDVLPTDPGTELELTNTFYQNMTIATKAGIPLPYYLKIQGWPQRKIDALVKAMDEQAAKNQAMVASQDQGDPPGPPSGSVKVPAPYAPNALPKSSGLDTPVV